MCARHLLSMLSAQCSMPIFEFRRTSAIIGSCFEFQIVHLSFRNLGSRFDFQITAELVHIICSDSWSLLAACVRVSRTSSVWAELLHWWLTWRLRASIEAGARDTDTGKYLILSLSMFFLAQVRTEFFWSSNHFSDSFQFVFWFNNRFPILFNLFSNFMQNPKSAISVARSRILGFHQNVLLKAASSAVKLSIGYIFGFFSPNFHPNDQILQRSFWAVSATMFASQF